MRSFASLRMTIASLEIAVRLEYSSRDSVLLPRKGASALARQLYALRNALKSKLTPFPLPPSPDAPC